MTSETPFYMTNNEWYYFDKENWCYRLTDKAPEEAIKSYNEFYEALNNRTVASLHIS